MRLVFTRSDLFFPHGPHAGSPSDKARLDRTRAFSTGVTALVRAGQEAGRTRRDFPADQIAENVAAKGAAKAAAANRRKTRGRARSQEEPT